MSQERTSSLDRFRALTDDMKKQVHADAVAELNNQANGLKDTIEAVAPVYQGPPIPGVQPGALKVSVRVVPDRSKDTVVRVVAGGPTTTGRHSRSFDYARAVEFGTLNMKPEPFFFPTYRLMKKRMISTMKRRITQRIKKYSAESGGNV